jgi:hypothetical protein
MKKSKLPKKQEKIAENWIKNHGAASFDFRNRDIILHDGGIFAVTTETKTKPRTRIWFNRKHPDTSNGHKCYRMISAPIKKNGKFILEKVDYYSAILWFEELDETIAYFKSMARMLRKLGFNTNRSLQLKKRLIKGINKTIKNGRKRNKSIK